MDVKELIALMKAERCLRVKMGGLEVELSPTAFAADPLPAGAEKAPEKPTIPEDFTLWSVQDQSPLAVFERTEEAK